MLKIWRIYSQNEEIEHSQNNLLRLDFSLLASQITSGKNLAF